MENKEFLCFKITDSESGSFWCKFYNVTFFILAVRDKTVICKCCTDEDYYHSKYNIHEFPKTAGKFVKVLNFKLEK